VPDPAGLEIAIPGEDPLVLRHLVLDLNGTLARDGALLSGVAERVVALAPRIATVLVSGDTFGTAAAVAMTLGCRHIGLEATRQGAQKLLVVEGFGPAHVVMIGNGRNDAPALAAAALGICVLGPEGAAAEALSAARVVVGSPTDALDLLAHPDRLVATLRR
jgi:P-type E1-E2 ATPase